MAASDVLRPSAPSVRPRRHAHAGARLRQRKQQHFFLHAARSELLLAGRVARDSSFLCTADEHADRACTWIDTLPQHMLTVHGIRVMEH